MSEQPRYRSPNGFATLDDFLDEEGIRAEVERRAAADIRNRFHGVIQTPPLAFRKIR